MPVQSILIDGATKENLHTVESLVGKENHGYMLVTDTPARAHGRWNAVSVTGASTTIVAQALTGGSLIITDIVLLAKKKTASTVLVQFTDGSNTEVIMAPDIVNNPVNIAWSPAGLVRGWKDARIELVTDATFDCTLTIVYIKLLSGEPFAVWDADR